MSPEQRRARVVAIMLTAVLPGGLVAIANAAFILDHFYARQPYLLDAGWLSAVVHRSGIGLANPLAMQHYGATFYNVHVSPFMSLFSLLSYVTPLDRIGFYALFQGVVYAPLGVSAYFVASRSAPVAIWRLPLTAVMALCFSFSGQVLVAIEYPHFEIAIPGLTSLLLGAVVTNRRAWIWPLLALALSVREDAGFHLALALCPLLYLTWRGALDPALRKTLFVLIGVSIAASVVAFGMQHVLTPPAAVRMPFFGTPFLHHLAGGALRERITWLFMGCPFIIAPLGATIALALLRRDARYLLGWLAAMPWLVVNLLAYEEGKWRLAAYIGFPFVVSVFWVYLYGSLLAPPPRRLARGLFEVVFAGICVLSIIAVDVKYPPLVNLIRDGVLRRAPAHPKEVRAYAKTLHEGGAQVGRFCVDGPVAALAVDIIVRGQGCDPGTRDMDTFAFHREGPGGATLLVDMAANGVAQCTHVLETGYCVCASDERLGRLSPLLASVPTERIPALLVVSSFDNAHRFEVAAAGVVVPIAAAGQPNLATRNLAVAAGGSYEIVWDLALERASADPREVVTVDVVVDGEVAGKAATSVDGGGPREQLVLPFTVRPNQPFGARLWYRGAAKVVVEGAQLRAAAAARAPP
jgi:hypothetical protein